MKSSCDFQMPCDLVASYTCIRLKPSSDDPGAEAATHGSGCLFGTVMTQTLPPLAAAFNRADETAQTERNGEWLTVCLAFASAQRIVSRR